MKTKHIQYCLLAAFLSVAVSLPADAKGEKKKARKSQVMIEVVSADGSRIGDYTMSSSKNRREYTPDDAGMVKDMFTLGDVLKIKAPGYKTSLVELTSMDAKSMRVVLEKGNRYEDEDHQINTVYGGTMSELRTVGSFSQVSGDDLYMFPSMSIEEALSGRLNGYFYRKTSSEPGGITSSEFVRGQSGGTPVIMVDGVVRSLDLIDPETIESVQLLKDASLKALYGGVYANGILMVKTKRGKAFENTFNVNVMSGVGLSTAKPDYLNSREYAKYYNQAMENIGLRAKYDPDMYDGSRPYQYPDVDWYGDMLNDFTTYTKANAQFSGGSRNTKYFLHVGYQGEEGMEKYTKYPKRDNRLTVRGNVDNTIFDFITLNVGVNAALDNTKWSNVSMSDYFSLLSSVRPNEFPMAIPASMLEGDYDYEYLLGGSSTRRKNPLGEITRNGYKVNETTYVQSDFDLIFDFHKWVTGLKWSNSLTFDVYNVYTSQRNGGYAVYEPIGFDENGNVSSVRKWDYDQVVTSLSQGSVTGRRNWHFRSVLDYDRVFGTDHKLSATLMYFMQQMQYHNELHSVKRINVGARVNYAYKDKYIVDVSANYVGVPSFAKKNRFGLFPTAGLGWVASNEGFLEDAKWLDFLKVRASYGVMGSTPYSSKGIVSNYYYKDLYSIGSSYGPFTSFDNIVTIGQIGNPDIGFQKTAEFNAGIDFEVLDHSLAGSVGFFNNQMTGGIVNSGDVTPGVSGKGSALMYENVKAYRTRGMEAELYYTRKFGDFKMKVGGNIAYGESKTTKELQVAYPDDMAGLLKTIYNGDVKGYQVIGTFQDQADIDNSPKQTFGSQVFPGDFKYKDVNGDGYVNAEDQVVIANQTPKVQYGITINLEYKGFNLNLLGYGLAGFDTMLSNSYYQIYGGRKYSRIIENGLPNGNPHPILRAGSNSNNFVDSDYWVAKGGFFKLRDAEFGYTFPVKWTSKVKINKLKIFARGTNLFTISNIKDLDPECIDAGISGYPLTRTVTGGLSFSF